MIEHKSFDVEIKADDAAGTVELYAATFGVIDRAREVIDPGAFANLDGFTKSGWLAVNHDWKGLAVATIESASQDAKGLRITAKFHSTPEAQAVRTTIRERLERGKSVPASIGYKVLDDATEQREGKSVRVLKSIELYEASLVNVPCNVQAGAVSVKSWWTDYAEITASLKAGRVISKTNRERMAAMMDRLRAAADDMAAMLAETDPETPMPHAPMTEPGSPKSIPAPFATGMEALFESRAVCARYGLSL